MTMTNHIPWPYSRYYNTLPNIGSICSWWISFTNGTFGCWIFLLFKNFCVSNVVIFSSSKPSNENKFRLFFIFKFPFQMKLNKLLHAYTYIYIHTCVSIFHFPFLRLDVWSHGSLSKKTISHQVCSPFHAFRLLLAVTSPCVKHVDRHESKPVSKQCIKFWYILCPWN